MSSNASRRVVCRLLGGSGLAPLVAVPTRKLPALLVPSGHPPADAIGALPPLPLAA